LVVITIISMLIALLLPAVQAARESSRRTQCCNNVRQLGLGLLQYHLKYGQLPPGTVRRLSANDPSQTSMVSWIARILPQLEQQTMFKRVNWEMEPGNRDGNAVICAIDLRVLRCPSDEQITPVEGYAPTNYVVCIGHTDKGYLPEEPQKEMWGVFGINSATRFADIRDGSSNTMLVSECIIDEPKNTQFFGFIRPYLNCLGANICHPPRPVAPSDPRGFSWFFARRNQAWTYTTWVRPNDKLFASGECERQPKQGVFGARSRHPEGLNVLLGDGRVEFTANHTDAQVWKALGTRAGDELLETR
jgi:prepilin-type processing-associated H-X9-DG protein